MDNHPPTSPAGSLPEDANLYCLNCGYNLRGLSGDPRRCPECGHMNPLGDLELPAEMISRQLRKMETAPTVCVGVALALALYLAMAIIAVLSSPRDRDLQMTLSCCSVVAVSIAVVIWVVSANSFCRSCGAKPGWSSILWHYHLYGIGSCGIVLCGYLIAPMLIRKLVPGMHASKVLQPMMFLSVGWTVVVLVLIAWQAPRVRAKAREEMHALQREVAVSISRNTLKGALATRHEWGTKRKL